MSDHEAPGSLPPPIGALHDLIDELTAAVEGARSVPLSSNVMLDRKEFLAMLQQLRDDLPDELRAARWMVREREAFVARTNEKVRALVDEARDQAAQMTSESYIVKEAVAEANSLVRNAETEARRIRLEAEDLAEARLAETESLLADILSEVRAARAELHEARPPTPQPPISR